MTQDIPAKPLFASDLIREFIKYGLRWGIPLGIVCGFLAGIPVYFIGALCGMPFGLVVGGLSGFISGSLLAIITTERYLPITHASYRQYRLVAALLCVAVSLAVVGIFVMIFFHPFSYVSYYVLLIIIPTTIAAIWSSHRLAGWYIRLSQPASTNASSLPESV